MSSLLQGAIPYLAGGTIQPATFVKLDTTADKQVVACGAGGVTYGISQDWANGPTYDGQSSPPAATAGQPVAVYHAPCITRLTLGTGGATHGDKLKSDANSCGVTTTTSGDAYGAIALQSGLAGDKIDVQCENGVVH